MTLDFCQVNFVTEVTKGQLAKNEYYRSAYVVHPAYI